MRKIGLACPFVLIALATASTLAADKNPDEPFYRRYLVAGNPLDDKIMAQEKKVLANPDSADLRNDFGNLLAARRFPKEAREQYERAMKLDRSNFLAPYNLGLLYETQGKTSSAMRAYAQSVDRNRGFPPARFRLGRLYEKRGWKERAVQQYARALQIDPAMRDPRRNPLVIDTRLMDRVSLENYTKDIAAASLLQETAYAEGGRWRRVPMDRPLASQDLVESSAEPVEPAREPAPAARAPAPAPLPARPGEVRPQGLGGATAPPPPPPAPTSPPPAPTPFRPVILPAPLPTPQG